MAARRQTTFKEFEHRTSLHYSKEVLALNNKFPDLRGYGVLCYLMELCGASLTGKIEFSRSERNKLASAMNMDVDLFDDIILYLYNTARLITLSKSSGEHYLSVDELDKKIIKKRMARKTARERVAERRLKASKKAGIRIDVKDSAAAKRRRMHQAYDEILILTDRIINEAALKFPNHGSIRVYFREFKLWVKTNYQDNWGVITHETYVTKFFTYMNAHKQPLLEALQEDDRPDKDFKNTVKRAIKFKT